MVPVTLVWPVKLPIVAVIVQLESVALPSKVTNPVLLTMAQVVSEEVHAT
jgi:hypothetical protein